MDLLAYMEHFQFILNKFDDIIAPMNKLLIWYFRDGQKPSIYTQ